MRKFVLAGAVPLVLLGGPVSGEPLVRIHTSYYYIDGTSASVLAAQLDQQGPADAAGNRYAGRTRWNIQWKLKHAQQGSRCAIKSAAVAVGVAQTMPKWRAESKGTSGLRAVWARFIDRLQRHEDVHKDHGVKAAREIEAALLSLKPASNCEDLETAANARAQAIVQKYQALDEAYDARTAHGQKEGVTLL